MFSRIHPKFRIIDAETRVEIGESEIREKVGQITDCLEKSIIGDSDVILIDIPRSVETIFAVLSCLQLGITFTFCRSNRESHRKSFRTTLIFDGKQVRSIENSGGISAFFRPFQVVRLEENREKPREPICYVIETSGTTGIRKQVAVPDYCIRTNIDHFCSAFSLTSSDSILFSTSLHFDPSIVEMFMAFRTGCTLILTPDEFRRRPHLMQKTIDELRPTVAQFTPTVFEMLSPSALSSATSSLRILLIGGAHFPLKFCRESRSAANSTRVFNVYGVTEVSCWATFSEIEPDCSEVKLGTPIRGTSLEIAENGELVLGGPRQCYVNGEKRNEHRTGDLAERTEHGYIRIVGRIDRTIKLRGVRVCLDALESAALLENPDVRAVHFALRNSRNLIQFTVGLAPSRPRLHRKTMRIDENTRVPVTICHVASDQFPINASGKIDETALMRHLELAEPEPLDFRRILESRLKTRIDETRLDASFAEIGLKSLEAAELSSYFESDEESNEAIRMMLDGKTTIRRFLERFGETVCERRDAEKQETCHVTPQRQPRLRWAVDLKKCIDGNVLVVSDSLVVCASHSGCVVAVNPRNGRLRWRQECAVRFEATPVLAGIQIVIGNKASGLYFLSLDSGDILARCQLDPTFGVRSKCAFDGEFVYATAENGVLHVIDTTTRMSVHSQKVGNGGSSVGPVIGPDRAIYATTTSGGVTRITKNPFVMTWHLDSGPMFAEPTFLEDSVLVLNVHGTLRILNAETGQITHSISLKSHGNCFCAPLIIDDSILVATNSGNLIHLNDLKVARVFRFDLPGTSFARTPRVIRNGRIALMSKCGWLLTARLQNRNLEDVTAWPVSSREVFTSPEFLDDDQLILIAGRDDLLRAWSMF